MKDIGFTISIISTQLFSFETLIRYKYTRTRSNYYPTCTEPSVCNLFHNVLPTATDFISGSFQLDFGGVTQKTFSYSESASNFISKL